jgi:hypothetical protein
MLPKAAATTWNFRRRFFSSPRTEGSSAVLPYS